VCVVVVDPASDFVAEVNNHPDQARSVRMAPGKLAQFFDEVVENARLRPRSELHRGMAPDVGMIRIVITRAFPKRFDSCGLCAVGGAGFFSLVEFVEEAASLFFIGGVPPFNECEPVGAAKSGHQNIPLALPQGTLRIAGPRDAGGDLSVDPGAIVWGEGQAVEHPVAAIVEPEAVPGRVDRLATGAKVSKEARVRLAVDALAFDQLPDEHATYVVAVAAAPPRDEHAS
jgi:hypothetical protein